LNYYHIIFSAARLNIVIGVLKAALAALAARHHYFFYPESNAYIPERKNSRNISNSSSSRGEERSLF
jgi:hypothetical protein